MPSHLKHSDALPAVLAAADHNALRELATPLLSDNLHRLVGLVGLNSYNGRGIYSQY